MKLIKACSLLAALSVATYAQGAVVLSDSFAAAGDGSTGGPALAAAGAGFSSYTYDAAFLTGFTASGSDKLVLGFGNKDDNGDNLAGPAVSSVTYNGAALAEVVQHDSLRQRQSVFYLDNVASDGDLVVTFSEDFATTEQGTWGLALYALNGTADGTPAGASVATAVHPGTDLSAGGVPVTVTGSSAFVVNLWTRNNGNPDLVADANFTDADLDENPGISADMGTVFTSAVVNAPGDYASTVSGVGGGVPTMTFTGVAFEAVPEPSSLALLGLGSLLIARRRRD